MVVNTKVSKIQKFFELFFVRTTFVETVFVRIFFKKILFVVSIISSHVITHDVYLDFTLT